MRHSRRSAPEGRRSLGLLVEDVPSLEGAARWAARFAADQGLRLQLLQALDHRFQARQAIAVADRALQTAREAQRGLDVRVRSEAATPARLVTATSPGLAALVVADHGAGGQAPAEPGLVLETQCPVLLVTDTPGGPVLLGTWRPRPAVPAQRRPLPSDTPDVAGRRVRYAGTFDPGREAPAVSG